MNEKIDKIEFIRREDSYILLILKINYLSINF